MSEKDLEYLDAMQKQKVEKQNNTIVVKCEKSLKEYFDNITDLATVNRT